MLDWLIRIANMLWRKVIIATLLKPLIFAKSLQFNFCPACDLKKARPLTLIKNGDLLLKEILFFVMNLKRKVSTRESRQYGQYFVHQHFISFFFWNFLEAV